LHYLTGRWAASCELRATGCEPRVGGAGALAREFVSGLTNFRDLVKLALRGLLVDALKNHAGNKQDGDAAAAPRSQAFMLIGTLFLLPIILTYTGWSYWVFRGKVREDVAYH